MTLRLIAGKKTANLVHGLYTLRDGTAWRAISMLTVAAVTAATVRPSLLIARSRGSMLYWRPLDTPAHYDTRSRNLINILLRTNFGQLLAA